MTSGYAGARKFMVDSFLSKIYIVGNMVTYFWMDVNAFFTEKCEEKKKNCRGAKPLRQSVADLCNVSAVDFKVSLWPR